ncbi:hypothetical protein WDU94_010788 [Cyamophila willieti]
MPQATTVTEAGKRCKAKWDNLMRAFRNHQKHVRTTGAGTRKTPQYYEEMDRFNWPITKTYTPMSAQTTRNNNLHNVEFDPAEETASEEYQQESELFNDGCEEDFYLPASENPETS